MDGLRALIQRAMYARCGEQINAVRNGMTKFVLLFEHAKRTRLQSGVCSPRQQRTHVQADQLRRARTDELRKGLVHAHHAVLIIMQYHKIRERIEYLSPLLAGLGDLRYSIRSRILWYYMMISTA